MSQATMDRCLSAERFNMGNLYDVAWQDVGAHRSVARHLGRVRSAIGDGDAFECFACNILRHAFLIELVTLPGVETARVRPRWCPQLRGDPRECGYDECMQIAGDLFGSLSLWHATGQNAESFALVRDFPMLPYEMPLDYAERPSGQGERIHRRGNLAWYSDGVVLRTAKLRKFLLDKETSPDAKFFSTVLKEKIKVKTYLTDRAKTGDFKTNREKRWEAHPGGVQFCLRRTALAIEYKLVTQICGFEGFPEDSRKVLQQAGVLPARLETYCCPITLEPISFQQFREALLNPTHGKSDFQIGHLNPLKIEEAAADAVVGHTADNIGWISADGNQIQGNMCLDDLRKLLKRIARNYGQRGWL